MDSAAPTIDALIERLIAREEWRAIPEAPLYEISSFGRVRKSLSAPKIRQGIQPGGLVSAFVMANGYPAVNLLKADQRRTVFYIHRLLGCCFLPGRAAGLEIAHLDGDKENYALTNLKWLTHEENMAHTLKHGTRVRGEDHPAANLTDDVVRLIKRAYVGGYGDLTRLSERFDVPLSTISNIIHGYTWAHVSADVAPQ